MVALIGRILPPAVIAWIGVLYLLVLTIGIGLTAMLAPVHALAGFDLLQVAIGPMWPSRVHFFAAAAVFVLPALALLERIQAGAPTMSAATPPVTR